MDLRFACLTAFLANVLRDPKKPAYAPKDFMLDFLTDPTAPQEQTAEQQYRLLQEVTAMTGGKVFPSDASDEEIELWLLGGQIPEAEDEEFDGADAEEYEEDC